MKAIVIGAGIAGIASSIRLAKKGYEVKVLEKNSYPGGKLSEIRLGNYRFDAGPSLFTMPHFVEELFLLCDEQPEHYFNYSRVEAACHYFYPDRTRMIAWSDRKKLLDEFHQKTGVDKVVLQGFLEHSAKLFDLTHELFMESPLNKLETYLKKPTFKALQHLGSLDLLKSMNEANEKRLGNDKMVQYFNRFATYNGSDPYQTPGVLNVIPHLEHGIGTFFPKGGMISITNSLVALAKRQGVKFEFESSVDQILLEADRVKGVRADGEILEADVVVSNSDIYPCYDQLLQKEIPKRIKKAERSSSAIIFYWGIKKRFSELGLHNIFFSGDYRKEFDVMFREHGMYEDPTIYIHISSKQEANDAPDNSENWFVMVNAPANRSQDWDKLLEVTRERVLKRLSSELRVTIEELIEEEDYLDPRRIESKTSSYMGSLYGTSSNDKMSAFLRHPNYRSRFKGLYFCGGSVHPGGGIPLCLLSAKIATDEVPEA